MSDQNTEDQNTNEPESSNIRRMRERINELEADNKQKADALRMAAFSTAGFDPEAPGIDKAVFRTYDGPSDPEAIVAFATQEYGWTPPAAAKARVDEGHKRLAALDNASVPESPPVDADLIGEAEKNGNWQQSMALKAQKLRQMAG